MNFENAQTFCGSLLICSANNGASLVCAKNLKDKQNKRKQKRIKTKREKGIKRKSPTGCGLEPPEAAAHQLAQPAFPRNQPSRRRPARLRRRGGRRRCSTAAMGPLATAALSRLRDKDPSAAPRHAVCHLPPLPLPFARAQTDRAVDEARRRRPRALRPPLAALGCPDDAPRSATPPPSRTTRLLPRARRESASVAAVRRRIRRRRAAPEPTT